MNHPVDVATIATLRDAIHSREPVAGLTHPFYRYPARFSPLFARAVIDAFSRHGELVIDPFMGGGTTIVEAHALGRRALGVDINSLSQFITAAKTTVLSEPDLAVVARWAAKTLSGANLKRRAIRDAKWLALGYQRNLSGRLTWRIRKLVEFLVADLVTLRTARQQMFARCAILKTAQWALDCRVEVPSAERFRLQFATHVAEMSEGVRELREATAGNRERVLLMTRSTAGLENDRRVQELGAPRLILTSPPYPGVHVVYHRWQVFGRKETPAPYWIANSLDGNGLSHYTFGHRKQRELTSYFLNLRSTYESLAKLATDQTILVQMVAFSEVDWQLPRYLATLEQAGFEEVFINGLSDSSDKRVWRAVPNRKWYADQRGETSSSNEVVLFHRRRR